MGVLCDVYKNVNSHFVSSALKTDKSIDILVISSSLSTELLTIKIVARLVVVMNIALNLVHCTSMKAEQFTRSEVSFTTISSTTVRKLRGYRWFLNHLLLMTQAHNPF